MICSHLCSNIYTNCEDHWAGLNLSLYFLNMRSKHRHAFLRMNREVRDSYKASFYTSWCSSSTSSLGACAPTIASASDWFISLTEFRSFLTAAAIVLKSSLFCSLTRIPCNSNLKILLVETYPVYFSLNFGELISVVHSLCPKSTS